jgi:glycosyltransferase involved in cell wall biosynthesis
MQTVKDQTNLTQAFVLAIQQAPRLRSRLRLIMVGDGPLRQASQAILDAAGMADLAWLPGERQDVPDVMRGLDCFVLPSIAEGVSNTILEAMASGLPVIATAVGGNPELVVKGESGLLVPPSDPAQLAAALIKLADDPERACAMGKHGRRLVESNYSMGAMVRHYQQLYDRLFYGKMRQEANASLKH